MKLPFLISVPHAGTIVPPEVEGFCILKEADVIEDGDKGASEIYGIQKEVVAFATTEIARAIVDLNRREADRSADGVVKTHTIWNVPIYGKPLTDDLIELLLERYYRPYHELLRNLASKDVVLGIDCHTMAAESPPIEPDAGTPRPAICLSNAFGTCPDEWINGLAGYLGRYFSEKIAINHPFKGGYIIRTHFREMPWMQLEISRGEFASVKEKKEQLLQALWHWGVNTF